MLDQKEQERVLRRVADAAAEEGCSVAPIGSVFYLFHGSARALTKDVDAIIHGPGLDVANLSTLQRIAARLGRSETTHDGAVVAVHLHPDHDVPDIELARGRRRPKQGFLPRALLEAAAQGAVREDNILIYPQEYVLVLKADAAVDREDRAARHERRAAENLRRADVFRADVFAEAKRALLSGGLDAALIARAIGHLKKNRRSRVGRLLVEAGVPLDVDSVD